VIGLGSNAITYLAFLGLTSAGVGHKTAMSTLYLAAALATFHAQQDVDLPVDAAYRTSYAGSRVKVVCEFPSGLSSVW
jgi:hypothetical protein